MTVEIWLGIFMQSLSISSPGSSRFTIWRRGLLPSRRHIEKREDPGTRLGSSRGCSLLKLLSNTLVSFTSCCDLELYHSVICGQLSVDLRGFGFRFNLQFLCRRFVSFWPTSPMIALYSDFGPTGFLAGFSLTFQGY